MNSVMTAQTRRTNYFRLARIALAVTLATIAIGLAYGIWCVFAALDDGRAAHPSEWSK